MNTSTFLILVFLGYLLTYVLGITTTLLFGAVYSKVKDRVSPYGTQEYTPYGVPIKRIGRVKPLGTKFKGQGFIITETQPKKTIRTQIHIRGQ